MTASVITSDGVGAEDIAAQLLAMQNTPKSIVAESSTSALQSAVQAARTASPTGQLSELEIINAAVKAACGEELYDLLVLVRETDKAVSKALANSPFTSLRHTGEEKPYGLHDLVKLAELLRLCRHNTDNADARKALGGE